MYLEPPEKVAAGLNLEPILVEIETGGLHLRDLFRRARLRVELPYLPPHVVVRAVQVRVVSSSCSYLQLPHFLLVNLLCSLSLRIPPPVLRQKYMKPSWLLIIPSHPSSDRSYICGLTLTKPKADFCNESEPGVVCINRCSP